MERVLNARGDWMRLLGLRSKLDRISLCSGGHLRDFLRIIAEVIRRADQLPVEEATLDSAINQVKMELLPIAEADAEWLARIAETHEAALADISKLPDLARFLDTHMALCYRNGNEWFDVHPLIRREVIDQAMRAKKPKRATKAPVATHGLQQSDP
jgi:hypothetical protein